LSRLDIGIDAYPGEPTQLELPGPTRPAWNQSPSFTAGPPHWQNGIPIARIAMTDETHEDVLRQLITLGHLSAAVGHHVINAFSAIVSNAELVRLRFEDPDCDRAELAAFTETIVQTSLNASTVARRLIDFTRRFTVISGGPTGTQAESIDLTELVKDVVASERQEASPNVQWVFQLPPVPRIQGNRGQLRLMLHLLIRNALESLEDSDPASIRFATSEDDRGWVILEIEDSGSGMAREDAEQALNPFFSTKPERLGLGLTIAHSIWRRHRGTLSIAGASPRGTKVRLVIEPDRTAPISYSASSEAPSPGGRSALA
jgi:signal transduction histidine kinase